MVRPATFALAAVAALSAAPMTRAQDRPLGHDTQFCRMLRTIRGQAPERVQDVVSGTIEGDAPVEFRRRVVARVTYVLLVALTAPATDASVMPAARAGSGVPQREGQRIAHDFTATARGVVTIAFRAPAGTAYHAALYRLPPPPPSRGGSLGVRPSSEALRLGGFGTGSSSDGARPPDCAPVLPERLGGPRRD